MFLSAGHPLLRQISTKKRGTRPDGDRTREAILDAAELLFSIDGLTGVSIRKITLCSATDLASVNYHFGSKEALFHEVLIRRVNAMSEERRLLLTSYQPCGDLFKDVRALLSNFIYPLFGDDANDCEKLANYRRLISLVANSKTWQDRVFREHYDPTAHAYIKKLDWLLSELPFTTVCWAFNFFLGALTNAMAETGRIDRLSEGLISSSNLSDMKEQILCFTTSALVSMNNSGAKS